MNTHWTIIAANIFLEIGPHRVSLAKIFKNLDYFILTFSYTYKKFVLKNRLIFNQICSHRQKSTLVKFMQNRFSQQTYIIILTHDYLNGRC